MPSIDSKLKDAKLPIDRYNILYPLFKGIKRNNKLDLLSDDLLSYLANEIANNRLFDTDGKPIRNYTLWLIKVNSNKESLYNEYNPVESESKVMEIKYKGHKLSDFYHYLLDSNIDITEEIDSKIMVLFKTLMARDFNYGSLNKPIKDLKTFVVEYFSGNKDLNEMELDYIKKYES